MENRGVTGVQRGAGVEDSYESYPVTSPAVPRQRVGLESDGGGILGFEGSQSGVIGGAIGLASTVLSFVRGAGGAGAFFGPAGVGFGAAAQLAQGILSSLFKGR